MAKLVLYIENSADLDVALELIKDRIPCFVYRIYIEMDYSEVSVCARIEDMAFVERILAPLVQGKRGIENESRY